MVNIDAQLLAKLQLYLSHDQDAIRFIKAFGSYCHEIDDIIDEKITDPEKILRTFVNAAAIYSCNFYQRFADRLYPTVLLITNEYADSVKWEKNDDSYKEHISDVLRSCGNNMLILVVGIVAGYEAMRDVSCLIRETSYLKHHDELGKPV